MTGGYFPAGYLSNTHPAVRLIVCLSIIQAAAVSSSPAAYLFFTLLFALTAYASATPPQIIIGRFKPFLILIFSTFVINISIGSGLATSAELTYRFMLIIAFSILLTASMQPEELIAVLLIPFRGRHAQNLKVVMLVAVEFIPVFIAKAKETVSDIKKRYPTKTYKALLKPELYIRPITEGLADMAEETAEGVENGSYLTPPVAPMTWGETLFSFSAAAMAVIYAI